MELKTDEFRNKLVVVTGGASGIGEQTARAFAGGGADVRIIDIKDGEGQKLSGEIENITYYHCDVRNIEDVRGTFSAITEEAGQEIYILVNLAGLANRTPVVDIAEEEWDLLCDVNLKASFFCAQEAARSMIRGNKGGRIINIASTRACQADGRHTIYDTTKAGVQAMARSLAVNLAKYGITANAIGPGYVLSPMTAHNLEDENWLSWYQSKVPLGRMITYDEVVSVIAFFCSEAASGITGQSLYVDGGWSIME